MFIRLELFRFHIHCLRCTSVFWAHFYSRLIQNFQILNTLTNDRIHGGYLEMTYVVEVPWFSLLLHKCILSFLKILEIWKFLHNFLLKSPTKMDVDTSYSAIYGSSLISSILCITNLCKFWSVFFRLMTCLKYLHIFHEESIHW